MVYIRYFLVFLPLLFNHTVLSNVKNAKDEKEYNIFDLMQEKERYRSNNYDVFEVTENDEIEGDENFTENIQDSYYNKEIQSDLNGVYFQYAKLVAINKITAGSKELTIKIGSKEYFGNIEINIEKCWYNQDAYQPSYRILTKVIENKIDEDPKIIFEGWFISSNIPLSNMEDPSYELIAISCHD